MEFRLGDNAYGKAEVRVVKVTRGAGAPPAPRPDRPGHPARGLRGGPRRRRQPRPPGHRHDAQRRLRVRRRSLADARCPISPPRWPSHFPASTRCGTPASACASIRGSAWTSPRLAARRRRHPRARRRGRRARRPPRRRHRGPARAALVGLGLLGLRPRPLHDAARDRGPHPRDDRDGRLGPQPASRPRRPGRPRATRSCAPSPTTTARRSSSRCTGWARRRSRPIPSSSGSTSRCPTATTCRLTCRGSGSRTVGRCSTRLRSRSG